MLEDLQAIKDAGFTTKDRAEWVRRIKGREERIGMSGPVGRWYAYIKDPVQRPGLRGGRLRGLRGGERVFKTAGALIKALDDQRKQEVR